MSDHGPAEHRAKHTAPIKAVLGFLGKATTREPTLYGGGYHGCILIREADAHYKMKLAPHVAEHGEIPLRTRRSIAEHIEALRRHLRAAEEVADLIRQKLRHWDRDPTKSEEVEIKAMLAKEDAVDALQARDAAFTEEP